jgi:glycosyltransferase involved in cell wall biosynthesis
MKLSVLISVYHKESPDFLRQSLESIAAQTLAPDEVVIVKDGPLGKALDAAIDSAACDLPIVCVSLPANVGLGLALRAGLNACRGEYIARMDSDDICLPYRFEKQMEFLAQNPQIDVLGSAIEEFADDPFSPHALRLLPATGSELLAFAKSRTPLNHVTVVFRKASVLAAGSYQHYPGFEDYHLWARMLMQGFRLHNMPEILVRVRCGTGMQGRRGGLDYLRKDVEFQLFLRKIGLLQGHECARNMLLRAPIRLAPQFVRSICYRHFLRYPANLLQKTAQ